MPTAAVICRDEHKGCDFVVVVEFPGRIFDDEKQGSAAAGRQTELIEQTGPGRAATSRREACPNAGTVDECA